MTIYTIGFRPNYSRYLAHADNSGVPCKKVGKGTDRMGAPYAGGSVWSSAGEALAHLQRRNLVNYSIYEVDADWDADTEQLPGEPFRRLLRDAVIVQEI
jgi:hypothetical protein